MKLTRVGVDLAKQVFQVHGIDRAEQPIWCKRLKRSRWIAELERAVDPGCVIGMEACGRAHHWARMLQSKGYQVKLIAPQFVKPYVKTNKTDANDAEAICEAMSRPSMRFVAVKTAVALAERSHPNVATVALANKLARIAWAMLRHGTNYEPVHVAA